MSAPRFVVAHHPPRRAAWQLRRVMQRSRRASAAPRPSWKWLRTPRSRATCAVPARSFLRRFPLPGMMGERLFQVIDRDNTGVIDKINYLIAVRLLTKESAEGKIKRA